MTLGNAYYAVREDHWPEHQEGVVTSRIPHGLFFVGPKAQEEAYAWAQNMMQYGHRYVVGILRCTAMLRRRNAGMVLS